MRWRAPTSTVPRRRIAAWMVPAAAATAVLAIAATGTGASSGRFWTYAALVALAELFRVPVSDGAPSLGPAPALALAMAGAPSEQVLLCYATGSVVAAIVRRLGGGAAAPGFVACRILATGGAAVAYSFVASIDPLPAVGNPGVSAAALVAAAGALGMLRSLAFGVHVALYEGVPAGPRFVAALRAGAPVDAAAVSVGALLALTAPSLGVWSYPLFVAPLAATQYSFYQVEAIRRTHVETLRALSSVPELAGYTRPGHAARVAHTAVAIGRELGLADTEDLEHAALLHDIGRMGMPDPEVDGGSIYPMELAVVGSRVAHEAGYDPEIVEMIRRQFDPWPPKRGAGSPLGARIIRVASEYDDLLHRDGFPGDEQEAIVALWRATGTELDPSVVAALQRVLGRAAVAVGA